MVLKRLFRAFALILLFSSCHSPGEQESGSKPFEGQEPDSVYKPFYATGFSISYYDEIKVIKIEDPWDSEENTDYVIAGPSGTSSQSKPGNFPFVEYPVDNWSAFSSTQVVFAEKIGVLKTLKTVAESQYISHPGVNERIEAGEIRDVGPANAADVEVLLDSGPAFIFVSPFKDNRYRHLEEAGLTLINDAGYLESSPLGRAEWFVFFSTFFDREERAIELFKKLESRYNRIRETVKDKESRPNVLSGTLFEGTWHLPAGDSYMARLFADAGADYAYKDKEGTGSLSLDFETVFNDFHDSDYWVLTVNHPGTFTSSDLKEMDERYSDFYAFENGQVLVSNTRHSLFFERGIIEPDVVLKDLAASFYPDEFPEYSPEYFHFLNDRN
ncbi:MAG: ABC transporter substrate-binding protein [Marinilabiliaceae bacterium]